jgi:UDP-glucuronate 4-epimerase
MKHNKTALITGGSGFIGSSLGDRLLKDGWNVINVDNMNDYYDIKIKYENIQNALKNKKYTFIKGDVCDCQTWESVKNTHLKIDVIFHLAARAGVRPSIQNPQEYERSNFAGSISVFEFAKQQGISNIVAASSSSVYGNCEKIPFSEDEIINHPISPYAATKAAMEEIGYCYHHLYSMKMVFLRFFTVYGERQRPDLAIHKFYQLAKNDNIITLFGDGQSFRDYTYIGDILNGIESAASFLEKQDQCFEIINLGSGHPITLLQMVDEIGKILGKKPKVVFTNMMQGDVNGTFADISKAKKLLGYHPKTSFPEGLKKFSVWFDREEKQ